MNLIKPKLFIPLFFFLLLYFFLRLQHLTSIPVFGDEAIYIRWSQLIKNVETLRFIPLTDGKQPLFMWITAASFKFLSDPLVAGRIISVISGALIMVSLYTFSLIFYNYQIAAISSLIYLLLPFSFFFDRLALPDNLLSSLGFTSLLLSFLLARYPRLDISMILGFILGLAWLTKSPAIYFVVLSIITFVLYRKNNIKKVYFPVLSSIIAFGIYNILRLGPQFHQIALRNRDYIWSLSDIFKHPLDPLVPHLKDIITIYFQYISLPLIIISLIGIYLSKKILYAHKKPNIIILWWILPLIANAAMAKVFTARYILFTLPPLILLLSFGIYYFLLGTSAFFKSKILQLLVLIVFFSLNIYWIYRISYLPFYTILPSTESGYLSQWTSGWGIKDFAIYLKERASVANVIVGTEGYFGTLPDGLQIYTDGVKQLTIFGVGLDLNKVPEKLIDARNHGDEVYLMMNRSRLQLIPGESDKLDLIRFFDKPGQDQLQLFKLK
jgi:4-amino-4-deoxy-L-arabinose transferase-like glycosyltransferase